LNPGFPSTNIAVEKLPWLGRLPPRVPPPRFMPIPKLSCALVLLVKRKKTIININGKTIFPINFIRLPSIKHMYIVVIKIVSCGAKNKV
jgi:hypothetical protein